MPGDKIVATRVDATGPEFGDVVVYKDPDNWLPSAGGEGQLIHRVIGVPGDKVACCDRHGHVSVNGRTISEPYLADDRAAPCDAPLLAPPPATCHWTAGPVPDGQLFVMGDNREFSADSRMHMCLGGQGSCASSPWVPIDLVRGIVELRR